MSFEKPQPIPENNELPLQIEESEPNEEQGRDTKVWKIKVPKGEKTESFALKQVRKDEFATEEEMKKSKEFYDFIKGHEKFGAFVPDTLYFKARENSKDTPHAYRLQRLLEGRGIDKISDEELYADPSLMKELLRFIDATKEIIEESRQQKGHVPDLYGNKVLANYLFNPRYTSNVIIADRANPEGHRIFFIDTNPQIQQLEGAGKAFQKNIGSKLQLTQLNRWGKEIQRRLAAAPGALGQAVTQ